MPGKRGKAGSRNSFLNRLLRDLEKSPNLRSGRESIAGEAKDLFEAACLYYIRDRYGDFQEGLDALDAVGIDYRKGVTVSENASGSYQLTVAFSGGSAQIPDLAQYFTDTHGVYNSKGYYDEQTVSRFNTTVFDLLDDVLGARK